AAGPSRGKHQQARRQRELGERDHPDCVARVGRGALQWETRQPRQNTHGGRIEDMLQNPVHGRAPWPRCCFSISSASWISSSVSFPDSTRCAINGRAEPPNRVKNSSTRLL